MQSDFSVHLFTLILVTSFLKRELLYLITRRVISVNIKDSFLWYRDNNKQIEIFKYIIGLNLIQIPLPFM
jgi:hypothetical protein